MMIIIIIIRQVQTCHNNFFSYYNFIMSNLFKNKWSIIYIIKINNLNF